MWPLRQFFVCSPLPPRPRPSILPCLDDLVTHVQDHEEDHSTEGRYGFRRNPPRSTRRGRLLRVVDRIEEDNEGQKADREAERTSCGSQ